MESNTKPIEDIDAIRTMMERSTRFLSLSGLSGIVAGLIAIAGSIVAIMLILKGNTDGTFPDLKGGNSGGMAELLFVDAIIILTLAVASALILSNRKAVKQGMKLWTPVSKRLLLNISIPLISGGLFIILLYNRELYELIIPAMLFFYGLALVSAGKFTFDEVFYLGVLEIATGFTAGLFPEYGIFLWIFGFGILHVVYGLVLYRKYDR